MPVPRCCSPPATSRPNSARPDFAVLDLDRLDLADEPETDPVPRATPDNLAYLIYTSGSTGRPKAVAAVHGAVVQLVTAQNYAEFGPEQTHLLHSPVTFDAATFEIWGALLTGARLAVALPGHSPGGSTRGDP